MLSVLWCLWALGPSFQIVTLEKHPLRLRSTWISLSSRGRTHKDIRSLAFSAAPRWSWRRTRLEAHLGEQTPNRCVKTPSKGRGGQSCQGSGG